MWLYRTSDPGKLPCELTAGNWRGAMSGGDGRGRHNAPPDSGLVENMKCLIRESLYNKTILILLKCVFCGETSCVFECSTLTLISHVIGNLIYVLLTYYMPYEPRKYQYILVVYAKTSNK